MYYKVNDLTTHKIKNYSLDELFEEFGFKVYQAKEKNNYLCSSYLLAKEYYYRYTKQLETSLSIETLWKNKGFTYMSFPIRHKLLHDEICRLERTILYVNNYIRLIISEQDILTYLKENNCTVEIIL